MSIEVSHLGHTYTYRHPVGWSGGVQHVREELNEHRPASEYPAEEAEEMAVRHALKGILGGGEVVKAESGRPIPGGDPESEGQAPSADSPGARPERILEATGENDLTAGHPDRILEDTGEREGSGHDPDRILED